MLQSIQPKLTLDNIVVRDSTVLSTVTLRLLIPLVQNMSFSQTSRNIRLSGLSLLMAECHKHDGSWVPSTLDLDTGIGNNEGYFDTSRTDYFKTAGDVSLSGTILTASLMRTGTSPRYDSIDLDPIVANHDGVLTFQK